ncbi:formyl transferase, partial [Campylobacter jejuni]|nr:formyl transferase [Campylobacter jejuni]
KECASLLYESLILFLEDNVKAYKQKRKKKGGGGNI